MMSIEESIKEIYVKLVKEEKLVHRFRKNKQFLKIYYHGQKMYDVYENKIEITESVLNVPSKFFARYDIKPRTKHDVYISDDPKHELGGIQLVLSTHIQKEQDVHNKFKDFINDLKTIQNEENKKVIDDLISELELKEQELKDNNLFDKCTDEENDEIRFFDIVEIDYEGDKHKQIELLKILFEVIDRNVLKPKRLFQATRFYDKNLEYKKNLDISDEEKISRIVNEYINEQKPEVYEKRNLYDFKLKNISLSVSNRIKEKAKRLSNSKNVEAFKKGIEKYKNYSFYEKILTEIKKIEDYLLTDLTSDIPKFEKINIEEEISLKKYLELECLLLNYTIGKPPFKKIEYSKEIEVREETIKDFAKFKELTKALKKGIDKYNEDSLAEKKFQDLLMQEEIATKISRKLSTKYDLNLNLFPLEEEFGICVDEKVNKKFFKDHEKDSFIENSNYIKDEDGKKNIGRIDNVYLNDKEIFFVEVKMNHSVIRYADHGIAKHLEDMYKWGLDDNSKRNKSIEDLLKGIDKRKEYNNPLEDNLLLIGSDNKNYCDLFKDYFIICGYNEGSFEDEEDNKVKTYRDKIIELMNEPEEKKHIREFINLLTDKTHPGIKFNTKIILVKVLSKEKIYYDIDENSIEVVEYNNNTDNFEAKAL